MIKRVAGSFTLQETPYSSRCTDWDINPAILPQLLDPAHSQDPSRPPAQNRTLMSRYQSRDLQLQNHRPHREARLFPLQRWKNLGAASNNPCKRSHHVLSETEETLRKEITKLLRIGLPLPRILKLLKMTPEFWMRIK